MVMVTTTYVNDQQQPIKFLGWMMMVPLHNEEDGEPKQQPTAPTSIYRREKEQNKEEW